MKKSRRKFKKFLKQVKMETQYAKTMGYRKAVLRKAVIREAINAHIKKVERYQINNLSVHLKKPEKQEQTKQN
jgi:hypothetical protein